jgi:hypothetical protein
VSQRGIARDVQQFVHDHLTSVAQLEILLLLHRDPSRRLTAHEVSEALRIDPEWAGAEMSRLVERGLFVSEEESAGYCFAPSRKRDAQTVDDLARLFSTHRVSVITLIFSRPSDSIGSFADAFKLRRDDDG